MTQARGDWCAYGGGRRQERRELRGLAMPAAVTTATSAALPPMRLEDNNEDGGEAPRKGPWAGRSEPPGQPSRVAVVGLAGPPPNSRMPSPRTPVADGYADNQSSTASRANDPSALFSPDSG